MYPTDQRGFQRVVNNLIDVGAFENQSQWFNDGCRRSAMQ